jgi:hypothetical protein
MWFFFAIGYGYMWFYKDIKIVHKVSKNLGFKKIDDDNHM